MLLKLLKYDIKFGKNSFLGMAAALIMASVVLKIVNEKFFSSIGFSALIMLFLLPAIVLSVVLIFQGFSRSLYGDQGYLMLTLPVKKNKLLLSQTIVSMLWFNVMIVAAFVMIMIVSGFNIFQADMSNINIRFIAEVLQALLLINLLGLFCIITFFLAITSAKVSFMGKRVHAAISALAIFLFVILEWEIQSNIIFRFIGHQNLYYYEEGGKLIFTFSQDVAMKSNSLDLTSVGGMVLFLLINYFITLYLLKKHVDLR